MEFVDTHCHLNFQAYDSDLAQVISRAAVAGVDHIVVPGLDLASSREAVEIANKYETTYAAVGVHPEDVEHFDEKQMSAFEDLLSCSKVVAIGEIGLDYYHRQDQKELQQTVLKIFLDLAIKFNKPVILHSRDSLQALLLIIEEILSSNPPRPISGIFHSFEGNLADAARTTELGFFIGVGGPITYKNALTKHEVFSKINLTKIVLETDAPFLPPQLHRGKRNEPSYIPLIAERLAEIQHCDIKEVAHITTGNTNTLFNWK